MLWSRDSALRLGPSFLGKVLPRGSWHICGWRRCDIDNGRFHGCVHAGGICTRLAFESLLSVNEGCKCRGTKSARSLKLLKLMRGKKGNLLQHRAHQNDLDFTVAPLTEFCGRGSSVTPSPRRKSLSFHQLLNWTTPKQRKS